MNKHTSSLTLPAVMLQESFDFMCDIRIEIPAEEKGLTVFLEGIDYKEINAHIHRDAEMHPIIRPHLSVF